MVITREVTHLVTKVTRCSPAFYRSRSNGIRSNAGELSEIECIGGKANAL